MQLILASASPRRKALLSLFGIPFTVRAEDIDEVGFQYPLEHAALTPDFPVGVSNHIMAPQATITVRKGALAVGWQLPSLSKE